MEHCKSLLDLWSTTTLLFGQQIDVIAYQLNPEKSLIGQEIHGTWHLEVSASQPLEWLKVCCQSLPNDEGICVFFPHTTPDQQCKRHTSLLAEHRTSIKESFTPIQNLSESLVHLVPEYPTSVLVEAAECSGFLLQNVRDLHRLISVKDPCLSFIDFSVFVDHKTVTGKNEHILKFVH